MSSESAKKTLSEKVSAASEICFQIPINRKYIIKLKTFKFYVHYYF